MYINTIYFSLCIGGGNEARSGPRFKLLYYLGVLNIMNTYISQSNQKLLWKTMSRSPLFQRKQKKEDWFKNVIGQFYENNKTNPNISLKEINVNTINYMLKNLQDEFAAAGVQLPPNPTMLMQQTSSLQPISMASQMSVPSQTVPYQKPLYPPPIPPATVNVPHTKQDLQNMKRNEFDSKLEQAKLEHQNLLQRELPPQIDFRDKAIEETPITNMNELIQKEIEKRNMEIYPAGAGIVSQGVGATVMPDSAASAAKKNVSWKDSPMENTITPMQASISAPRVDFPVDYIAKLSEMTESIYRVVSELKEENAIIKENLLKLKEENQELYNVIKTIIVPPEMPELKTIDVSTEIEDPDKLIDDVMTKLENIYNAPISAENCDGENEMKLEPDSAAATTEDAIEIQSDNVSEIKQAMDAVSEDEPAIEEPSSPVAEETSSPRTPAIINLNPTPTPAPFENARRRRR